MCASSFLVEIKLSRLNQKMVDAYKLSCIFSAHTFVSTCFDACMVGQNKCDSLQLHNRSKSIFLLHILPVVAPINTGHCLYGEAGRAANGNHGSWTNTVNAPDLYNLLRCGFVFVLYALWNWRKVDWLTVDWLTCTLIAQYCGGVMYVCSRSPCTMPCLWTPMKLLVCHVLYEPPECLVALNVYQLK